MAKAARYTVTLSNGDVRANLLEKSATKMVSDAARNYGLTLACVRADGASCTLVAGRLAPVGTAAPAVDPELAARRLAAREREILGDMARGPARVRPLTREEAAEAAEDHGHYAEAERIRGGL